MAQYFVRCLEAFQPIGDNLGVPDKSSATLECGI
jgi:hypothetical protein